MFEAFSKYKLEKKVFKEFEEQLEGTWQTSYCI